MFSSTSGRPWLWPNLLSLDAPVVAVLWQALFVRCFHAGVNAMAAILLALAVWLIYAADRVFDAWTAGSKLPRHEFYRRNWPVVLPIWSLVLALTAWLAWSRLRVELFERGAAVLAGVAIYFTAVHLAPAALRRVWPKEIAVAILFALGASLSAWGHLHSAADIATIFLFSCLCWINCAAIEFWEHGKIAPRPIALAATAVAAAALFILWQHRPVLAAAEAASALGFVLLNRARHRFSNDALRVLADVALLSPVIFLPLAGSLV